MSKFYADIRYLPTDIVAAVWWQPAQPVSSLRDNFCAVVQEMERRGDDLGQMARLIWFISGSFKFRVQVTTTMSCYTNTMKRKCTIYPMKIAQLPLTARFLWYNLSDQF